MSRLFAAYMQCVQPSAISQVQLHQGLAGVQQDAVDRLVVSLQSTGRSTHGHAKLKCKHVAYVLACQHHGGGTHGILVASRGTSRQQGCQCVIGVWLGMMSQAY